jgi:hypothetical protein
MARLLSADAVSFADGHLPRGRLLVLGGEHVYPTATRENYQRRFRAPFEDGYAPRGARLWDPVDAAAPHLSALPGDHDWHDGLDAFSGLFCRRRTPQPAQNRAARGGDRRAPYAADAQLFRVEAAARLVAMGHRELDEGYIDQPQIDYFSHAATHGMAPESKLILCVGEPVCANAVSGRIDDRYRSFIYLERLAGAARGPRSGAAMGHRFKLVLIGDSHHYSRFLEDGAQADRTMSPAAAARPRASRINSARVRSPESIRRRRHRVDWGGATWPFPF